MDSELLETRGGQALVSAAAGLAGVAGSYAATGYTPSFVASPIERTLARTMPDAVVSFAITTLGSLGQQLNLVSAIGIVGLLFSVLTAGAIVAGQRANNRLLPTIGTAVFVWLLTAGVTGTALLALGPALPAAAIVGIAQLADAFSGRAEPISSKRRRALSTVGVAIGASAVGYQVGGQKTSASRDGLELSAPGADPVDIQSKMNDAEARSLDVDGIEPLVSQNFYEVDINSIDPDISPDDYTLTVTGEVTEEVTYDYDELQEMPAQNQFATLRCVGDSLNGQKIDTALWTGVPLSELTAPAGPQGECDCVLLRSEDGYEVEFPLAAFNRGLAVYGMNGEVLPRGHGYPVRAVIPGNWGEAHTKWLTEIEFINTEIDGYWEERGWDGAGEVKQVANLHHDELLEDGTREVAGHAYGGLNGVSAVEVSTDGGTTWSEATISEPLPSVDGTGSAAAAWRQWEYTYETPDEPHEVVVRMIDADGNVQSSDQTGPFPDGAAGWVSQQFEE